MSKFISYWETDSELDYDILSARNEGEAIEIFKNSMIEIMSDWFNEFFESDYEFELVQGNEEVVREKLERDNYKVVKVIKAKLIRGKKDPVRDYIYLALVEVE